MEKAIYAGSFDPVTLGHLDIIKRAAALVDELTVVVMINEKKKSMFSLEERKEMVLSSVKGIANVKVDLYKGLLVDYAKQNDVKVNIRGVRGSSDLEYELVMAQTNKALYDDLETVFLVTNEKYSFISSSNVKEVAVLGGNISKFVTKEVEQKVLNKLQENNRRK